MVNDLDPTPPQKSEAEIMAAYQKYKEQAAQNTREQQIQQSEVTKTRESQQAQISEVQAEQQRIREENATQTAYTKSLQQGAYKQSVISKSPIIIPKQRTATTQ